MVTTEAGPGDVARYRNDLVAVALLTLLWLGMIALVNPVGNFPLDDDWAYARAVARLTETGSLRLEAWGSMTAVAQVLWGSLFVEVFGLSFTVLRASTLVLGLLGVLATYGAAREAGADRHLAALAAATIATNPLYFLLSNSFMTDVPFLALTTGALYGFLRGLRRNSTGWVAVGALLAAASTLVRQVGIMFPIAFVVAYLARHGVQKRSVLMALWPAFVSVWALILFEVWLTATDTMPTNYISLDKVLVAVILGHPASVSKTNPVSSFWMTWPYLGAFVAPMAVPALRRAWALNRTVVVVCLTGAAALTAFLSWRGLLLPLAGNVIFDGGLGPTMLRDTSVFGLRERIPPFPRAAWVAVTFVALASAGVMLWFAGIVLWRAGRRALARRPLGLGSLALASLVGFGIYLFLLVFWLFFFDRYVLPLVVPAIMLVIWPLRGALRGVAAALAWALVAASGAFGVAGTHDYLAWNRARWDAIHHLTTVDGASPGAIDGGFEYGALLFFDEAYTPRPGKSDWWVYDDEYVITVGPFPGYGEVGRWGYTRWLRPGTGYIYALRRNGPPGLGATGAPPSPKPVDPIGTLR